MRTRTIVVFVVLLSISLSLYSFASLRAAPAADAVVNAPCTEAAFNAALNSVQSSGGGTITFACGGPATISLNKQKKINEDVIIDGGNTITLSGSNKTRLFNVAGNASLILRKITLADGDAGSGNGGLILNVGVLTVNESTLRNGHAARGGGIFSQTGSTLAVNRSLFTGNSADITGGAIEVKRATALIQESTISGNNAGFGGGIFNALGDTTMRRVTVSNNTADAGAGVNNNRGTMSLVNSTISNNTANAGGGVGNSGVMTLTFVTLSGNSAGFAGGIYHYGFEANETLTMSNTILNAGASGENCYNPTGSATPITSVGFNLSSDASCNSYFTQPSDQKGVNPLLGALANNGGTTMTNLPATGSPVINRGQCLASVIVDQRSIARPQGPACDIGAVEVAP